MNLSDAGRHAARPWATFHCEFCRNDYTLGQAPVSGKPSGGPVVYKTLRCQCPKCKASNPPVVNTQGQVRWHKCHRCGENFQSIEDPKG